MLGGMEREREAICHGAPCPGATSRTAHDGLEVWRGAYPSVLQADNISVGMHPRRATGEVPGGWGFYTNRRRVKGGSG